MNKSETLHPNIVFVVRINLERLINKTKPRARNVVTDFVIRLSKGLKDQDFDNQLTRVVYKYVVREQDEVRHSLFLTDISAVADAGIGIHQKWGGECSYISLHTYLFNFTY